MDKEQFELWAIDRLSDRLEEKEQQAFEAFLKSHPEYQDRFEELRNTWKQIDEVSIPEPSEAMDTAFYHMLADAREKNNKVSWLQQLQKMVNGLMTGLVQSKLAFGMLLMILGLTIGFYLNKGDTSAITSTPNTELVKRTEKSEEEAVREKLVLTLLEQPSANQRLEGVSQANKFEKVDEKVIKALLKTLNNDPNVNVRLAAIESLTQYANDPVVREGLVQSIVQQESPILQVTLANLMVALQEKKSIEPFKKLMRTKELDTTVVQQIERSIQSII